MIDLRQGDCLEIMKDIQLADKYIRITTEIAYVEDLIKHDSDLALVRQLEQLRKEQKEVASLIDEYNGVKKNEMLLFNSGARKIQW